MKHQNRLILGCLAAATAGVVLGMLIAPEEGTKLRTRLQSMAASVLSGFVDGDGVATDDIDDTLLSHIETPSEKS